MKDKINILLIGSGGRESAIAWKLAQSERVKNLYVAPGNAGLTQFALDVNTADFADVKRAVKANDIDMIVVGPEQPLVDGIYDYFKAEMPEVAVIGPSRQGAMLEGSKEFAKEFMMRHAIPTARFMSVTDATLDEGLNFLRALQPPYVLKADGLAAGKGVLILDSLGDAKDSLGDMLGGMFGNASSTVVIEEFLHGIECSVFVLTDGTSYKLLPVAKDYKRVGEGDLGPNTGGMGSVSPVPFADKEFMEKVARRIVEPTLAGLKAEGIDYKGFIFLGLMNVDGEPYVIEYNVRMGDPETQSVMPRIKSDLVDLFEGVAEGNLEMRPMTIDSRAVASVVLVAEGYPGSYDKGKKISGLDEVASAIVFHAGTKRAAEGDVVSSGGRVLAVTAYGDDIASAVENAREAAGKVKFDGCYYRRDIGKDLIRLLEK